MLKSMTGFGSSSGTDGDRVYSIEIRSVNHRFCEVRLHVPGEMHALVADLEAVVRRDVRRGRVDVVVSVKHVPGAMILPEVDLARARGYKAAYESVAAALNLTPEVPLPLVLQAPGVVRQPEFVVDLDAARRAIEPALSSALRELGTMRQREGTALLGALRGLLEDCVGLANAIREKLPMVLEQKKLRFELRMAELMGDKSLDPNRAAQEIAIIVDRMDVTEELARLESHFAQCQRMFAEDDAVGRKLDFLLQEMHREANTIGSKIASSDVAHLVVELKSALERLREQIQNVE